MAEATHEDKITLNVVVEGDDPYADMFEVTVPLQERFCNVGDVIQQVYWRKQKISIYGLRLYGANLTFEQVEHVQLLDETLLRTNRLVASEWSSRSDVDRSLVHIIVRPRSRQVTNTHRVATPPSPETEFEEFTKRFNRDQLSFIQYVQAKRTSSFSAALPKHIRVQQSGPNYINIGRPADKVWLPIDLYHPVFGQFLRRLQSTDPIDPEVYLRTTEHFPVSQDLYAEETNNSQTRDEVTRSSLRRFFGDALQKIKVHRGPNSPELSE